MHCTWVKSLQGMHLGSSQTRSQGCFMLPVSLNRVEVEALIDTGCGQTLMKKAKGPYTTRCSACNAFMEIAGNTVPKWLQ